MGMYVERKLVSQNQNDWNQYFPCLLFAYCKVPQQRTEFSPFELIYGCQVRGSLDVPREEWTGDRRTAVPLIHVIEMRECMAEMAQLVAEHVAKSQ